MNELLNFMNGRQYEPYSHASKECFKNFGKYACNSILRDMSPYVRNHKYSYNPGGVAVSGDHSLIVEFHTGDFVHMFFNADFGNLGICYRQCYSLAGAQSGFNQWINFDDIVDSKHMAKVLMKFVRVEVMA
jgi:hypothetical protein